MVAMISKYWPWLIALLYFIWPYDVLPDFAVGPGWLDDLIVLGLAWWLASRLKKAYHAPGGSGTRQGNRRQTSDTGSRAEPDPYEDADPHKILGIEKGASKKDITNAYKRLAAQYHPDKVQHLGKEFQELAHKKFVAIQRAYDALIK